MARKWHTAGGAKYWTHLFTTDNMECNRLILEIGDNAAGVKGFYVSYKAGDDASKDIGPFETFEAAAACFETLVGLD